MLRLNVPVNNFSVMLGRRIQGGEKQTHFCTFSHLDLFVFEDFYETEECNFNCLCPDAI